MQKMTANATKILLPGIVITYTNNPSKDKKAEAARATTTKAQPSKLLKTG